jgi:hypothetical protein
MTREGLEKGVIMESRILAQQKPDGPTKGVVIPLEELKVRPDEGEA